MFQKEETHPYSNSIVSQNDEIWNFPIQCSNGFQDSSHQQLPENTSSTYNLNNSHDILSQFFSGKSRSSNECFTDHRISTDGDDSTYQLGAVDETFGFNELQESSKTITDSHNFESAYVVNPEFLHDDFESGGQNFDGNENPEHNAIEIKANSSSQTRGSNTCDNSIAFMNGELVISSSNPFSDHNFLDSSDGFQAHSLMEVPKQFSGNSHISESIQIEKEYGHEILTQDDGNFYDDLPEWKSSHETDKTLVEPDFFGLDLKSTKLVSGVPVLAECESGLSDDHPGSRFSTPELSHSSGGSVTPKTSQINKQFLSMRDVEFANQQNSNGNMDHPFADIGHKEADPASPRQFSRKKFNLSLSRTFKAPGENSKNNGYDANTSPSSPSRRKKQRIEPKAIPSRFKVKPKSFIKLLKSVVKCLDVTLDYNGYTGIITEVILNNSITNYYRNEEYNTLIKPKQMKRSIFIKYHLNTGERVENGYEFEQPSESHVDLHCHMGVVQRKIYIRDISAIVNDVTHIKYHKSPNFNINNPYEPQYTRFETDESGFENNETKCGLCAYCKEVRFLPFKNSSYLSHMTLGHGVFADNFIIPEGINFGKYVVPRDKEHEPDKTKEIDGLQCPACLEVIEMSCWKTKENPLLKYFRHYKKEHVKDDKKRYNVKSKVNPLEFKSLLDE